MAKVNISLPDDLLSEVDSRAAEAGTTRSGFIREAATHYVTALDEEAARAARADRIGKAFEKMRSLAPLVGAPDAAACIREQRDAPPRWEKR